MSLSCGFLSWFCQWHTAPVLQGQGECSICLDPLDGGVPVVAVDCGGQHLYHQRCIQQWFQKKRSQTRQLDCPLCQQPVTHLTNCVLIQ